MGRVGYVPSLLYAEFVMGRVCHVPSLLCAELSLNPSRQGGAVLSSPDQNNVILSFRHTFK